MGPHAHHQQHQPVHQNHGVRRSRPTRHQGHGDREGA